MRRRYNQLGWINCVISALGFSFPVWWSIHNFWYSYLLPTKNHRQKSVKMFCGSILKSMTVHFWQTAHFRGTFDFKDRPLWPIGTAHFRPDSFLQWNKCHFRNPIISLPSSKSFQVHVAQPQGSMLTSCFKLLNLSKKF